MLLCAPVCPLAWPLEFGDKEVSIATCVDTVSRFQIRPPNTKMKPYDNEIKSSKLKVAAKINSFLPTQLLQMELTMRNTDKDVIYKQVHCGILCLRCCRAVEMPTTRTAGCSNNLLPDAHN